MRLNAAINVTALCIHRPQRAHQASCANWRAGVWCQNFIPSRFAGQLLLLIAARASAHRHTHGDIAGAFRLPELMGT